MVADPPAPVSMPPTGTWVSWPRTAPAVNDAVWVSAANEAGSASICATVKPVPVSWPCAFMIPVVNGPCMQPELVRVPFPASTGFGNAMRGGPALPTAAWWMCVAVFAGLWYSPVTPVRVMS